MYEPFTWPTILFSRVSSRSMMTRSPLLETTCTLHVSGSYFAGNLFSFCFLNGTLSPSASSSLVGAFITMQFPFSILILCLLIKWYQISCLPPHQCFQTLGSWFGSSFHTIAMQGCYQSWCGHRWPRRCLRFTYVTVLRYILSHLRECMKRFENRSKFNL